MQFNSARRPLLLLILGLLVFAGSARAGDVYADPGSTRPLQPGASVPSARIESVDGQMVDLAELTRESGALLVFYRGGW
jgi:hypothetical protein